MQPPKPAKLVHSAAVHAGNPSNSKVVSVTMIADSTPVCTHGMVAAVVTTWSMMTVYLVATSAQSSEQTIQTFATVFTKEEVKACTRIRTPSILFNTDTNTAHVTARCCGKNMCSSKPSSHLNREQPNPNVGDNDKDAKVIMKTSTDLGLTWGHFQVARRHI